MFTSQKVSQIVHLLAFVAGNGAVLAFVPDHYKELVTLVGNFIVGLSAWYDTTHGDTVAGRA